MLSSADTSTVYHHARWGHANIHRSARAAAVTSSLPISNQLCNHHAFCMRAGETEEVTRNKQENGFAVGFFPFSLLAFSQSNHRLPPDYPTAAASYLVCPEMSLQISRLQKCVVGVFDDCERANVLCKRRGRKRKGWQGREKEKKKERERGSERQEGCHSDSP